MIIYLIFEGLIEKFFGWLIGNIIIGDIKVIFGVVVFFVFYIGIFVWYRK